MHTNACFSTLYNVFSNMAFKVGIVGAGSVGKTLGKVIAKKHPVLFGVRDTAKYTDLAKAENTTVLSVHDAVKASDVVILAVPGEYRNCGPNVRKRQ